MLRRDVKVGQFFQYKGNRLTEAIFVAIDGGREVAVRAASSDRKVGSTEAAAKSFQVTLMDASFKPIPVQKFPDGSFVKVDNHYGIIQSWDGAADRYAVKIGNGEVFRYPSSEVEEAKNKC